MFSLFYIAGSWAVSNPDILAQAKVKSLSSYKSYLDFERWKREYESVQKEYLELRRRDLKLEKQEQANQDQSYLLDFLTNVQSKEFQNESSIKPKQRSDQEKAFFVHQKKQQFLKKQRAEAFLKYKKDHKKYQKRQSQVLSLRLKVVSALRDEPTDSEVPVFLIQ